MRVIESFPIDEAPRDGTEILAFHRYERRWLIISWVADVNDPPGFRWVSEGLTNSLMDNHFELWVRLPRVEGEMVVF